MGRIWSRRNPRSSAAAPLVVVVLTWAGDPLSGKFPEEPWPGSP